MTCPQSMTSDAKSALTPKLRFPAFWSAGAWTVEPLGNICDVLNNRRRPISSDQRVPGPYPYYGASGIVDHVGEFIFDERLLLVGEDGAKWEAFEKTAFIAEGKYWVNNHAHVLKPTGVNDALLENYLTMADLGPFVTGAAPPKLTLGKLKSIPIPIPESHAEQQKIAECLSTLDELIGVESQKLGALKAHKKGLMQQLFPREGEALPRIRFPEFKNAPEWEEKPLGEVCEVLNGKRRPITSSERIAGQYPYYGASGIVDHVDSFIFDEPLLLVGEDGAKWGAFEKTAFVARGKYWVNNHAHVLKGISVGNDLLENYLIKTDLSPYVTGAAPPKLTLGKLKIIPVPIPPTSAEEQRIASCLSSLDELIAAQNNKLDVLKTHKKGLMQQLFPSLAEAEA